MNANLHYSHSPLTEAVIDFRVELPESVTLPMLAEIQQGQERKYPFREDRILMEGVFTIQPDAPPASGSRTLMGYSFISKARNQIAQARLDGFTFSRLTPYENWGSFRDEARRWWNLYRDKVQPKKIARVAVRYINRIDLPSPVDDLTAYLRTSPTVSSDLQNDLLGFFMQLHIIQLDLKAMLILSEAIIPPSGPDIVSVLLDIDLFRESGVPQTEEQVWAYLEQLRQRKNEIFEACITDQTRELIR